MSEHDFIDQSWSVIDWPEPGLNRYWFGLKARGGAIIITRLRPDELAFDAGRFARFSQTHFEHLVPFMIPQKYGYGPGCDDRGLNEILDCIAEHTLGRWSLRLAEKSFRAKLVNLPVQFDEVEGMKWPYPVFTFEDHRDAVKLMLMRG